MAYSVRAALLNDKGFFMSQKNTNFSSFDRQMMKRCLLLARKGSGFTAPNPMVGAVIVKDGKAIAEGYHEYYGGPHAEIKAIEHCKEDLKGAHIYVNLEPCSHYGKTAPCSLAIINQGFAKVFIANRDPNPLVAGKGIEALQKAGIEVFTGLLEKEAKKLNEKFFHFISTKTPFIALKTAHSIDGKIATSTGESQWITNEKSRAYVQDLRQDYSAILVGIGTILKDNPRLTVRKDGDIRQPIRILVDTTLKTPLHFNCLKDNAPVIIATSRMASTRRREEYERQEHIQTIICPLINGQIDLAYLFQKLGEQNIDSILIEGGGEINFHILKHKLAHKIYAFTAPIIIGGKDSKSSFGGSGFQHLSEAAQIKNISYKNIGTDMMMEGYF